MTLLLDRGRENRRVVRVGAVRLALALSHRDLTRERSAFLDRDTSARYFTLDRRAAPDVEAIVRGDIAFDTAEDGHDFRDDLGRYDGVRPDRHRVSRHLDSPFDA